jgi:drug/metabolite transporter (DMT)-like permease
MAAKIGILLAVLALLGAGTYPVFLKKVVGKLGEYTCLLFNYLVLAVVLAVVAVFTIKLKMPTDFATVAVIVGSIVGIVAAYLFYKAVNAANVTVVAAIAAMTSAWVTIVSYFLFGEKITLYAYISMALILIGAFLLAFERPSLPQKYDKKHVMKFLRSDIWAEGAGMAFVASLCFAFFKLAARFGEKSVGLHTAIVYMNVLMAAFILLAFLTKPAKQLIAVPEKEEWKWLGLSAFFFAGGIVSAYFAVKYAALSRVNPIIAAAPAVTAVSATAFLGERIKVHQYAGVVILVVGLVFLAL